MRIVTLIGNRPQFVKAAAVSRLLRVDHSELLVHSGQHYDDEMSAIFFEQLDLPAPDLQLEVGPGDEGEQLSRIMHSFATVVEQGERPDLVLVYGDTTTTLAGALSATRLGLPLAHVEAGMRSFDRTMPEERNRIVADHLATLCLCSTETAVANLGNESAAGRVELVGDVMADVSLELMPVARERSQVVERLGLQAGEFFLFTAHRAGNVDDPQRLAALVELLEALPGPVVFPVHPRTARRLEDAGLIDRLRAADGIELTEPLGYFDFTRLLVDARAVLTDSGGVQKEAYLAGVRCVTLRDTTEWVETLETGWNRLVGLDRDAALAAIEAPTPAAHPDLYGGGHAGAATVAAIDAWAATIAS